MTYFYRSFMIVVLSILLTLIFILPSDIAFGEPAATCAVPSMYSTIQAALDDLTCSEVNIAAGLFNERISIQRDVVINGATDGNSNPLTIIDGQQIGSVVTIELNPLVQFNHLVIQNGGDRELYENGGGINITGVPTVRINNVTFVDNYALQGGGIYMDHGTLLIHDSRFVNNETQEAGGGIYGGYGKIVATNVDMSDNEATFGGGIHTFGWLELRNSTFSENLGRGGGGALSINAVEEQTILSGLTFEANTGVFRGGAIYAFRPLELTNSRFDGNQSEDGGAIYLEGASLSLVNSHFFANIASQDGGAIFMNQPVSDELPDTKLMMNKGVLSRNSAENGGVIYTLGNIDVSLTDLRGLHNHAGGYGGFICIGHPNPALGVPELNIQQSIFADNSADASGGVAHIPGNVKTTIDSIGAYRNEALGGGVFDVAAYRNPLDGDITISNSIFKHNSTTERGGAVLSANGTGDITIQSTYASDNNAVGSGGAVFAGGVHNFNLYSSTFENNSSQKNGGALTFIGLNLMIDSVLFQQNEAAEKGGGLYVGYRSVIVRNSSIYKNQAKIGGGIAGVSAEFDISAVSIDSNVATESGGGISFTRGASGRISQASITNNTAVVGGGVYVDTSELTGQQSMRTIELYQLLIGYNTASSAGGGILIDSSNLIDVNIYQTAIYRNAARIGGGILHDGRQLNISNSAISENSAIDLGSAIFGRKRVRTMSVTIADNTQSGAIHKDGTDTVFDFRYSIIHNPTVDNCTGEISTIQIRNSLDSDGTCSTIRNALTGLDPMIAPLEDNGNDQMSHALLQGSPAIGAGVDCLEFDQHGRRRPSTGCDLGSFQSQLVPTAVTMSAVAITAPKTSLMIYGLSVGLFLLSGGVIFGRKQRL